ncbi:zinc ribbon domain-containing protein [Paenibacillus sp. L3-i20]|uniref:zinc ribbon domain-containing protein n=1 Tax=Paenibacillus sp. L3-i20 TaxID=2905833 RepID=UPI001EDD2E3B|nr:zinc ribbon domain-containing protein [Paenibacillus sp. L3-i20]
MLDQSQLLYCQSCGMPMPSADLLGTEAGGKKTNDYCTYCYEEGSFKQPDLTLEGMVTVCLPYLIEDGMEENAAKAMLEQNLPELKRWKVE